MSKLRLTLIMALLLALAAPAAAQAAPVVTSAIASAQTVQDGGTVTLTATATGIEPITFAWTQSGTPAFEFQTPTDLASVTVKAPVFPTPYVVTFSVRATDGNGVSAPVSLTVTAVPVGFPIARAVATPNPAAIGDTVTLDGGGSSDPRSLALTYHWQQTVNPGDPIVTINLPDTIKATFTAPTVQAGRPLSFQLSVTNTVGLTTSVNISTAILPDHRPVANAGPPQLVGVGDKVTLDGSKSTDPDGDALTYKWSLTSTPTGSAATLSTDPSAPAKAFFTPNVTGAYQAQLIVNDGVFDSTPATVQIAVVTQKAAAMQYLKDLVDDVASLHAADFKNANLQNALINKLQAVAADLQAGDYQDALKKLQNDILAKTDGFALTGSADSNDWIITQSGQELVYPAVIRLITEVQKLI